MERPFSYSIYQQGKRLCQGFKISNVTKNNNVVYGYVMDHKMYKVKLVFDAQNHLRGQYCGCTYAKIYGECQHTAALFIYVHENKNTNNSGTLREIYETYISSKPRNSAVDFANFEKAVYQQLLVMVKEHSWERLRGYCEELSRITYPSHHLGSLLGKMFRALNTLIKEDHFSEQILDWGIQSIATNKNQYFHQYILNMIKAQPDEKIVDICEQLLNQMPVALNEALSSQLLLLYADHCHLPWSSFSKKFEAFRNSETMLLLEARSLMEKKEYASVMKKLEAIHQIKPDNAVHKEIYQLYQTARMYQDPMAYVENLAKHMNYYDKDFTEIAKMKQSFQESWSDISYLVYDKLYEYVYENRVNQFIIQENEWEYALYRIYQKPTFENLNYFSQLIQQYAPDVMDELFFECVWNAAENARSIYGYEQVAELLHEYASQAELKERVDYMLYYLKKGFANRPKLLEVLDSVGENL